MPQIITVPEDGEFSILIAEFDADGRTQHAVMLSKLPIDAARDARRLMDNQELRCHRFFYVDMQMFHSDVDSFFARPCLGADLKAGPSHHLGQYCDLDSAKRLVADRLSSDPIERDAALSEMDNVGEAIHYAYFAPTGNLQRLEPTDVIFDSEGDVVVRIDYDYALLREKPSKPIQLAENIGGNVWKVDFARG